MLGNQLALARGRPDPVFTPDPPHDVQRPHRLVRITERHFPDQALAPGHAEEELAAQGRHEEAEVGPADWIYRRAVLQLSSTTLRR